MRTKKEIRDKNRYEGSRMRQESIRRRNDSRRVHEVLD
jgi:hypothetical protein